MTMAGIVVSAFPCTGKTWLSKNKCQHGIKILDIDYGVFKKNHPNFPISNYIETILNNMKLFDYILVTSHEQVRKALADEGVRYNVVYPAEDCYYDYIGKNYIREKQNETLLSTDRLIENWDTWRNSMKNDKNAIKRIELNLGWTLNEVIREFSK